MTTEAPDLAILKSHFQYHADWPKKGITFINILPALRNPLAFEIMISHILSHIFTITIPKLNNGKSIDAVVGLDARGFLLGPIIAMRLGAAFVPVRKQGKLPGQCVQATYEKEYGQDIFEMQAGSIKQGSNVLVIDDLIATGGSARAAGELVEKLGSKTIEYVFVVGLPFLNGASKLNAPSYQYVARYRLTEQMLIFHSLCLQHDRRRRLGRFDTPYIEQYMSYLIQCSITTYTASRAVGSLRQHFGFFICRDTGLMSNCLETLYLWCNDKRVSCAKEVTDKSSGDNRKNNVPIKGHCNEHDDVLQTITSA